MAVYRSSGCEPRPVVQAAIPTQNKKSALSVQILFGFEAKNTYPKFPKMLPLKTHVLKESTNYVVDLNCKGTCWEALISCSLDKYSSVA